jgi:hypothetical protein
MIGDEGEIVVIAGDAGVGAIQMIDRIVGKIGFGFGWISKGS